MFSQEKYTHHTVSKGETISKIAKTYNVSPKAIYELNPDARKGIQYKSVLIIPIASSNSKLEKAIPEKGNQISDVTHEVLPQETLYGIAKQYNVKVEDLYSSNPNLEQEGLKKGQTISIPQSVSNKSNKVTSIEKDILPAKNTIKDNTNPKIETLNLPIQIEKTDVSTELSNYEVLPKETLYSIAKQNGITVDELYKINQNLEKEGLKSGHTIKIPQKSSDKIVLKETPTPVIKEKSIPKEEEAVVIQTTLQKNSSIAGTEYKVLPKESLFSIAKKKGILVADLKNANPILQSQSLKRGQIISIPVNTQNSTTLVSKEKTPKTDKDLSESDKAKQITVSSLPDAGTKTNEKEYIREVLAKETKYGIAKEYGITVIELEKQNPNIAKKLAIGSTLVIRSSKVFKEDILNEKIIVEEINKNANKSKSFHDAAFLDQLIETASENIGTQYRIGGTTKEGFDCSGLICSTFGTYDIQLPRTSIEQSQVGVIVNKEDAQKGDLIFFKTGRRSQINHVGMVVEVANGDIKFIHASNSGVMISSIKEKYYVKRFSQINRVL
ncbi:peptidoglycan endopeptidase [Flavobacterium cellulosilyticum]|nr:peptidoglycan endopeptidase [Flavobacterium cellulosilyticum]